MLAGEPNYGGFWRRFAAMWLDVLCLLPITLLSLWLNERSRLFAIYSLVPGLLVGFLYNVYLVRRFGGTPGKLLMGLRVRRLDGSAIGYREALLRYLPEAILILLMSIPFAMATLGISDAEYHSLGWMERTRRLIELAPAWYRPAQIAHTVWVWSEFVVLLTNRKRRAIHDFIAGTVVLLQPAPSQPGTAEGETATSA